MNDEWRAILFRARKRLGMSREELARLSGVSASTVRGYELGRRHPKQDSLEAVLRALRLERTESNPIREGAGFAAIHSFYDHLAHYYFNVEELQEYVEECHWPLFVVNDPMEVVAANRLAGAVWGLDFKEQRRRRSSVEMNMLAVASEFEFPSRIENWDEVLELMCSIYKGSDLASGEASAENPYLMQMFQHFTDHDHRFLERLLAAWSRAVPSPAKVRHAYSITWNHPAGRMSFACMLSTANEREGLAFNDWIPANPETWTVLHELTRQLGEDPRELEARAMRPRRVLGSG